MRGIWLMESGKEVEAMVSVHQKKFQVIAAVGAALLLIAMVPATAPVPAPAPAPDEARAKILTHLKALGDRIETWKSTAEYNRNLIKDTACSLKGFELLGAESRDGQKPDVKGGFLFSCKTIPRERGPAGSEDKPG